MPAQLRSTRELAVSALLLTTAASCMLTAPLNDYPVDEVATSGGAPDPGGAGAGTAGDAGAPGMTGQCQTNADCETGSGDELYRCRISDHTCQPLKTGECPVAEGDAANPKAIFFGAFANLSSTVPQDNAIVQAHLLALDELSGKNAGGLPVEGGGPRRPLVLVVCNNSQDMVEAGLKHLIEDLEVPGVLATLKPDDLRQGFEKYAARDVFYLSPVTVTKTLVNLEDRGLLWNLLGQPADFAPAYVKLLQHAEDYVRATPINIPVTEPIRVALVTTDDAFDSELEEVIAPLLTFNGQPTSVNLTDGNYLGLEVSSTEPDLADITDKIVNFRPHIIVSMAGGVMTMRDGLIISIEANWDVPGDGQALPVYLLSPYNSGDLGQVYQLINANAEFALEPHPEYRFVGLSIASAEDSSLQNDYAVRLDNKFQDVYSDTANYYDAFYFLSYATFAAGTEEPLTGASIARGMQRLLSGEESFAPVPTQISDVYAALSEPEATILLESTLGPPGFDPVNGSRAIDASVLCFERMQASLTLERDVRRYDRELGKFRGTKAFCSSGLVP